MRYYLLFLLFIVINNACYDDDSIQGFPKENCFGRTFNEEESQKTYFFEKVDHCCFVKRTFSVKEEDKDTIDPDLLAGISHCCYAFPISKIEDIVEYFELTVEITSGYEDYEISIDCITQIHKINPLILLIILILIYF